MTFLHVAFDELTDRHVIAISASVNAAPLRHRPDPADVLRAIVLGSARCFEFGDNGVIVVSTPGDARLRIDAFSGKIFSRRALADDLRRLAADWECDTIETFVFDPRLASAITGIGGRVEAFSVALPVEQSDG